MVRTTLLFTLLGILFQTNLIAVNKSTQQKYMGRAEKKTQRAVKNYVNEKNRDEKKTQRTIASYAKYIERAEKKFKKAENAKNAASAFRKCSKDVEALNKRYDKFSDEIKENSEIKKLRERHLVMQKKLSDMESLATVEKIVTPYKRKLEKMEAKFGKTENDNAHSSFLEQLAILGRIYDNISEENRTIPEIVALKKRHDELIQKQKDMASGHKKRIEDDKAKSRLASEYKKKAQSLPFNLLVAGKNNKALRPMDIERLDKRMADFKIFADECEGKYAEPAATSMSFGDGYKANEVAELAKNRVQYRNQLSFATYKAFLDDKIKRTENTIEEFRKNKFLSPTVLDRFLYKYDEYCNVIIKTVTEAYKSVGKDAPEESFKKLRNMKATFKKVLKQVVAGQKWSDSKYGKVSVPFKNRSGKVAGKMGMQLRNVGLYGDSWYIEKNDYGIPLKKYAGGFILLKNKKESFCRKYSVKFIRVYDGNKYEPASAVSIVPTVGPVQCK